MLDCFDHIQFSSTQLEDSVPVTETPDIDPVPHRPSHDDLLSPFRSEVICKLKDEVGFEGIGLYIKIKNVVLADT
jgi:hypothetical protein